MAEKWLDKIWKEILITCFDEALDFFMPDLSKARDCEREVVFLREELPAIGADSDVGMRVPDVVASVPVRGGETRKVVFVIEQQHAYDRNFARRMFEGFYRVSDQLKTPVTSLAIFTGNIREESRYEYDCFGTRLAFEYNSYSVATADTGELRNDGRVFSVVVLAAKLMLDAGGDPRKRRVCAHAASLGERKRI